MSTVYKPGLRTLRNEYDEGRTTAYARGPSATLKT